jgi:hypothetical protein
MRDRGFWLFIIGMVGLLGVVISVPVMIWREPVLSGKEPAQVRKPIVQPLIQPGMWGVTQSAEVFNYYVDRAEAAGVKVGCRAENGKAAEPCITRAFEFLVKEVESAK